MTRRIALFAGIALALAVGLLLDLRFRGLAWQFLWSVTGEEDVLAQVRGGAEWLGNLTRPQPSFAPIVPIDHAGQRPFGINTFLQLEPDPNKVERQLAQISGIGFGWIRQEFPWEDIEIHAKGDFEDRRNVEVLGVISAWDKYDRIVGLAEQYDIQIQARLSNPPRWAQPSPEAGDMAPPTDIQDYVDYAVAVAERYKGRIHHYQIWNEPNIYPEWGDLEPVNAERYTELLCRTHDALKAIDPDIVIISGALAPTVSLTERDLNDFIFLERMYAAGAGACFDVLSMQGYGLNSGPTDRRMRPTTVNISRNLYIREMMVRHGDAHKPIWLSEAAWNSVPSEAEHPEPIDARYNFGQVTQDQAARYMPMLYERAKREWPWVGVINYWFFTLPDDSRSDESMYYFRMAEPDYSDAKPSYTPLPVYEAMRDYLATVTPTVYQGVHQVGAHYAIGAYADGLTPEGGRVAAPLVEAEGAQFGTAAQAVELNFDAYGTGAVLRWRGERIVVVLNGEDTVYTSDGQRWEETALCTCVVPQALSLQIVLPSSAPTPVALFDSLTVYDHTDRLVWAGLAVGAVLVGLIALALWRQAR
jgi:hypothetical protein